MVTSSSDRLLLWQGRALTSATIGQVRAGQTITLMGKRALPGGSVVPEKVNDRSSLISIDSKRSEQRPEVTDFDASSSALNGLESTPKDETSIFNQNLRDKVKEGLQDDELLVGLFMGYDDKDYDDDDETEDWRAFIDQLNDGDLENLNRILELGEPYDDDPFDKLQFFRYLPSKDRTQHIDDKNLEFEDSYIIDMIDKYFALKKM